MKNTFLLTILGVLLGWSTPHANAGKFANQFVEFQLPARWQCNLESAEWVCQSTNAEKKREAVIILAAKLKGNQDSLDQYLEFLKKSKYYTSPQGKPVKSDKKYAKTITVNNHTWVDSLHLESELPGYYTRYVATVKKDIGVLVTFSVNQKKYQEYLNEIDNMVKTLKVFRKSGGINAQPANTNIFENTTIPKTLSEGTVFGTGYEDDTASTPKKKSSDDDFLLYLLVGIAVIALIIIRRRRR